MRVLILGTDGYLGWVTAMHLSARGHDVVALDSGIKRRWELRCGVTPLRPVPKLVDRIAAWKCAGVGIAPYYNLPRYIVDIADPQLKHIITANDIDTIIHYAEQPSAPYSMRGYDECLATQRNNVLGTLSVLWAIKDTDIHLVKLGTMGEYGTPNIDIEEGWLDVEHKGRRDRVLYPKRPGSWYHASKVHDSANIEMACRVWGIRATDLNQGIVYGIQTPEMVHEDLRTSFHYDAVFGTALNRFVTQAALGLPPTIYGSGGQTRGWLNINDTLQCVELACLNPAERGEFRVFNQLTEVFSVLELAQRVAQRRRLDVRHIDNPRVEHEAHYYRVEHTGLRDLGLEPQLLTDDLLEGMIEEVERHKDNVDISKLDPEITWR